jgi:ribosome-associated protein
MIRITEAIALQDSEIKQRFVRAAGDRGRNAVRDATAVELRFDIGRSSLPLDVQDRLAILAGRLVTKDGILVMVSRASNSPASNRKSARARLVALLRLAAEQPTVRHAIRPKRRTARA